MWLVLNFNCVNSVYKTHYINNWRGVRVKEREIPGLIELKMEFESKLAGIKEYQELKSEFNRSAMGLIKEAIRKRTNPWQSTISCCGLWLLWGLHYCLHWLRSLFLKGSDQLGIDGYKTTYPTIFTQSLTKDSHLTEWFDRMIGDLTCWKMMITSSWNLNGF